MITAGTLGDIFPFLKLALALRARGNRVTFLGAKPHAHYVLQKNLPFLSIMTDEEYEKITCEPDLWHPRRGLRILFTALLSRIGRIAEVVAMLPRDDKLVLICHPLALPGAALVRADRPATPIIGVYLAPSNLPSCDDPMSLGRKRIPPWVPLFVRRIIWRLIERYVIDPFIMPAVNTARVARGLQPITHFFAHLHTVANGGVTLFPPWFCPTRSDWPQPMIRADFPLYDPHALNSLTSELNDFLAAGDMPIVFTPGTGNRQAKHYFTIALQVSLQLGKRAIFLSKYSEQIPDNLPNTILWQTYSALSELLPKVALLVHHGGIGTTAEALRAGVPQLVVPLAFDQFDNGAAVERLGVGFALAASDLDVNKLSKVLKKLGDSVEIALQVKKVAALFGRENSMDAVCEAIERIDIEADL